MRVRSYFPLVRRIAKRVQRVITGASLDDLIGDGSIGLIRSVDTFDPERGICFESYARKVIVGAMLNGLRRMDPIPERLRRRVRQAEEARYAAAQKRGTLPTMNEMDRSIKGLHHARTVLFRHTPLSLDVPTLFDQGALLDEKSDPMPIALRSMVKHDIAQAIDLLSERQRNIVLLHYYQQFSLHAIGRKFGISPQRVSQLHLQALRVLRTRIAR